MEGKARRHPSAALRTGSGTQARSGDEAERERVGARFWHLMPCCLRHHFVAPCLDAFVPLAHSVPLCKTGAVMRFGDHFCAADFYKSGICRGICGKIFSDRAAGAVGFLVTGAQRAAEDGTTEARRARRKRQGGARFAREAKEEDEPQRSRKHEGRRGEVEVEHEVTEGTEIKQLISQFAPLAPVQFFPDGPRS